MEFLLRLKHWQLFLLTYGLFLITYFINLSSEYVITIIWTLTPLFIFYSWIYAIAVNGIKLLPLSTTLKVWRVKVYLGVPALYLLIMLFFFSDFMKAPYNSPYFSLLLFFQLLSGICIFLSLGFTARVLSSQELTHDASFMDSLREFFLIAMFPITIWTLQPELNRMIAKKVNNI